MADEKPAADVLEEPEPDWYSQLRHAFLFGNVSKVIRDRSRRNRRRAEKLAGRTAEEVRGSDRDEGDDSSERVSD